MDALGLGSADNKGILSLLSAIEQTGDNFDTDPDSPAPIKDAIAGHETEFNQLAGLDIGLSLNKSVTMCLICGQSSLLEPSDQVNMIDISYQISSGVKIAQKIEDIVSRKLNPEKQSSMICSECYGILQQIDLLEGELLKYKRTITSKFSVSNPVKQFKTSPKKTQVTSINNQNNSNLLGYNQTILDTKMPLQFLASDKEIEKDIEHIHIGRQLKAKSKLDILTETMLEEQDYFNSSDDDQQKVLTSLECEVCNRKFKNNNMYQKHMKIHFKAKNHTCNECNKVFSSKSNLQAHLKLHFEARTYSCPHCDKEFKTKKSLFEHVSSRHNNEKKHSCCYCSETFSSRHLKLVHERIHNGERGFICDQCGDSFSTPQNLSHHKSKHTGDYQFDCRTCGKGFNNHKLLEEHEHIHTGNKPYQCKKCDKEFANRGSLWLHVKQHDKLKPYVCPDCDKEFSHSSHLAVHRRLHTGEKPYKCRLCAEGFISSNHLKRHMTRIHPSMLPFACGSCKQTFSLRKQLVAHCNQVHGGNVVEDVGQEHDVDREEANNEPIAIEDNENYNMMPVSLVDTGSGISNMLSETGLGIESAADQQRLVELLGQDGVSLGQTIVLIQVPTEQGESTEVKTIKVDTQN